jgi:hypothetical protein
MAWTRQTPLVTVDIAARAHHTDLVYARTAAQLNQPRLQDDKEDGHYDEGPGSQYNPPFSHDYLADRVGTDFLGKMILMCLPHHPSPVFLVQCVVVAIE